MCCTKLTKVKAILVGELQITSLQTNPTPVFACYRLWPSCPEKKYLIFFHCSLLQFSLFFNFFYLFLIFLFFFAFTFTFVFVDISASCILIYANKLLLLSHMRIAVVQAGVLGQKGNREIYWSETTTHKTSDDWLIYLIETCVVLNWQK